MRQCKCRCRWQIVRYKFSAVVSLQVRMDWIWNCTEDKQRKLWNTALCCLLCSLFCPAQNKQISQCNCQQHLAWSVTFTKIIEDNHVMRLYIFLLQPCLHNSTSMVAPIIKAWVIAFILFVLTLYCRWVDISTRLLRIREAIKKKIYNQNVRTHLSSDY